MKIKKTILFICLILLGLLGLCGCNSPSSDFIAKENLEVNNTENAGENLLENETTELIYQDSMNLEYAENFEVDHYVGGYTMLSTMDGSRFLIVPEKKAVPKNLDQNIVVLKRPLKNMYLVASGVMDMICGLNAIDQFAFSGQKQENWYVEGARTAMEEGKLLFAGKYNKPDYELLVSKGCTLAIENRMISHAPEVVEKLDDFEIPVMVEYSSYESHPMGKVEWVKFFGALLGKEEEAEQIFQSQLKVLKNVLQDEKTDQTVAFFFVTSNGLIQVRQSSDYVPKMIELAGGRYIFDQLGDEDSKRSTMNMQVEEFYDKAKDADFLIYNSSIDGGVQNIDELLEKCPFLNDFKAVKNKNAWCTTNDMYQQSLSTGYLIDDIHNMLLGKKETDMKYLFLLK